MIGGSLLVGAPAWLAPATVIGMVAVIAVLIAYWRAPARRSVRLLAATLKLLGILGLVLCLVEPLVSAKRPRDGANMFVMLTDDSQSLRMHDSGAVRSRGERLSQLLRPDAPWQVRLQQDFDVRWYAFDKRIRPVKELADLRQEGTGSAVGAALNTLAGRFRHRPVSGTLLFTDGITTDQLESLLSEESLPPVYPVLVSDDDDVKDLRITNVSVNQTNFEAAPITIVAEVEGMGYDGTSLVAQLRTESGEVLETQKLSGPSDGVTPTIRFEFRPAVSGVLFYELRVCEEGEEDSFDSGRTDEATLANNRRLVTVNRGKGPYRVLYVAGRPNWEFKFLRRAADEDAEVQLVGLLRIAKRETKFDFRGHLNERTNQLYRGFDNQNDEQAEQYDEPVLLRIGTVDETELRSGFPTAADELFAYDAIVLDDVEAAFFTRDQLSLLQRFVSQRGGGLMMLGGQESFADGGYRHTPIAEILPVYLDQPAIAATENRYRLIATREGMLQPWTRLRPTEEMERTRMNAVPPLHVLNLLDSIKPGATVLGYARASSGTEYPAWISQRFGAGRTLAVAVGDMWRWALRREEDEPRDLEKAWRQTIRWLVADVPKRVEAEVLALPEDPFGTVDFRITARDNSFEPLDNATVAVEVKRPDGATTVLTAEPSDEEPGIYRARYVPDSTGAYRVGVSVAAPDGSDVGAVTAGWAADPARAEFENLVPRRELFAELARRTGGEIVAPRALDRFVADLPNRKNVVTEVWVYPFWHQWWVLTLIVGCFVGEWALRRWKGLA